MRWSRRTFKTWFSTKEIPVTLDDREVKYIFTHGHCHSLALAIHSLTGWPLVFNHHSAESVGHVAVRKPDGKILDIVGEWTDDGFESEYYGQGTRLATPADVYRMVGRGAYLTPEPVNAIPFARLLLWRYSKKDFFRQWMTHAQMQ